jgi:hypothetical protein
LLQKAKKEKDSVSDEIRLAEQQTKRAQAEAAIVSSAADVEGMKANRLKLQVHDVKSKLKSSEAELEDAQFEHEIRMDKVSHDKAVSEARNKKEHERKMAKRKERINDAESEKQALQSTLISTEKVLDDKDRAKEEAAKQRRVAEIRAASSKRNADSASSNAASLNSVMQQALLMVDDKKKAVNEEDEKRRHAESRARSADRKIATAKGDRAAIESDRNHTLELEQAINSAQAVQSSMVTKGKKDVARITSSIEESRATLSSEDKVRRAHRAEKKLEENKQAEARQKRNAEEEKMKSERKLRAIQNEASRLEAETALEMSERQRVERSLAMKTTVKPIPK